MTVRVVTDDDAYAADPYYADLEAAGITVVNDARSSARDSRVINVGPAPAGRSAHGNGASERLAATHPPFSVISQPSS